MTRAIAAALALLIAAPGWGQGPPLPDDRQVGEMRERIDAELLPGLDAAAGRAPHRPDAGGGPGRPPLPPSPAGEGIDLDRLASGLGGGVPVAPRRRSGVLVFVSFSLPPASLRALAGQAARSGSVLVLRGLKGDSFRETAAAIAGVRRAVGAETAWMVDPLLFRRLGVRAVPVFAVTDGERFALAAGDVPLGYALERIGRDHPGAIRRISARAGKRLQDG